MARKRAITIHAGHNKNGKIACGASDYIDESKEARIIVKKVISQLKKCGVTAYDCTVNNGKNQKDVLQKIVKKCNAKSRIIDVSVHFNAFVHSKADDKTKGVEALVRNKDGIKYNVAKEICHQISDCTGLHNRGVVARTNLYFLNQTTKPALLIEVCFVDDQDDVRIYKRSKDAIAKAIASAIINYI